MNASPRKLLSTAIQAAALIVSMEETSAQTSANGAVAGHTDFYARNPLIGTNAVGFGNTAPSRAGLWWTWNASERGIVTIDTAGSEAETILSVFVGTNKNALFPVRGNDNFEGRNFSRVFFPVAPGTDYHILVSFPTYSIRPHGSVSLNLNLLVTNDVPSIVGTDDYNASHELTGPFARGVANSVGFTQQTGEPYLAVGGSGSTWWTWTAPADGTVTIDTTGSDFNTQLFILTGQTLTSLERMDHNDDYAGRKTSLVQFQAQARRVYQIAVTGVNGSFPGQGNISLNLYLEAPPETGGLRIRNSAVEVEIFGVEGIHYQLESSTDFAVWRKVGEPVVGRNALINWYFPTLFGQKDFYRAKPLRP